MKRLLCIASGLALLLAGAAAAAQDIVTDYDRGFQLSQLKTFGFATQERGGNDALADNPIIAKRVAEALRRELSAAGMQESPQPQFWIAYYASVKDRMDIRTYGWGRPYWGGQQIETQHYQDGTLVVDFIEAKTENHVWRGSMTDTVEPNRKHDKLEKAIAKLVRKFQADIEKQQKGK